MRVGGVSVGRSIKISLLLMYPGHNPDFIPINQILEYLRALFDYVLLYCNPYSSYSSIIHSSIFKYILLVPFTREARGHEALNTYW